MNTCREDGPSATHGKHATAHPFTSHQGTTIMPSETVNHAAPARLYELGTAFEGAAITATGALATFSGEKTGRSPMDKRIVQNPESTDDVWWGTVNIPAPSESFLKCRQQAVDCLNRRDRVYIVDGYAGWDPRYRLKV